MKVIKHLKRKQSFLELPEGSMNQVTRKIVELRLAQASLSMALPTTSPLANQKTFTTSNHKHATYMPLP